MLKDAAPIHSCISIVPHSMLCKIFYDIYGYIWDAYCEVEQSCHICLLLGIYAYESKSRKNTVLLSLTCVYYTLYVYNMFLLEFQPSDRPIFETQCAGLLESHTCLCLYVYNYKYVVSVTETGMEYQPSDIYQRRLGLCSMPTGFQEQYGDNPNVP